MSIDEAGLDSFGQLARALGILGENGDPNTDWFGDPVGGGASGRGLRNLLGNDGQREALVAFVDGVLGPPDRATRAGAVWVPLFRETTPQVTIYAVVEAVANSVHLGVGFEHTTAGALPTVATRIHVPIFRFARGEGQSAAGGDLPDWLLIGRPGGRVAVTVDATLRAGAPPAGDPSLGGIALSLQMPTAAGDTLAVNVELRDLQLPGAIAPRTFTLAVSDLDELDDEVFELIVGLVRAQADALDAGNPALRPFAALTGLLGLRQVSGLPPLPLADLPSLGVTALVDWVENVLENNAARDAWLGELASLLGATLDAPNDAVMFAVGAASVSVGVRVEAGVSSHPVLVPWVEIGFDARAGARARLEADLLRADTGTGGVTAFPDVRLEAVFGAHAGGGALLAGNPGVGSLHVGVRLDANRRPAFALTLHDANVAGQTHDLLDLSSPTAALDAVDAVIDGALTAALDGLGVPGELVKKLIGLDPPAGVTDLDATDIIADPIGAIRGYWQALVASPPAMAEVLGVLRRLMRGGAAGAAPGNGTVASPWRIDFADGIGLAFFRGTEDDLVVELAATVAAPVLVDFTARATFAATLLRASFSPVAASFASDARGTLSLQRTDGERARLDLGPLAIGLDGVGLTARWSPGTGFRAELDAGGLALEVERPRDGSLAIDLPLPRFDASGALVLASPDWLQVEAGLAALLETLHLPVIDAALALLGWSGVGAHLPLAGLLGPDPALAVEAWLGDLILDCQRLRIALRPVAAVLSGFTRTQPFGIGSARRPYRCPIAGEPRAPGLAAWLVADCPPTTEDVTRPLSELSTDAELDPGTVVAALTIAARTLPDVGDLLTGRGSLAEGLTVLSERWTGTDGLVGAPVTLPDGVAATVLTDLSYGELVAQGSTGELVGDLFAPVPAAVVHVGCEATWSTDRPAGRAFDLTAPGAGKVPAAGAGSFFIRLPAPSAARAARPDRGAIGEQAARLIEALADRTQPIAMVAYGAAGAAAIRAAAAVAQVTDVVTVGTPWAGLALDALASGLSGDALVLLGRLLPGDASVWSDPLFALEASPLEVTRELVKRSLALVADPAELPGAESEVRRAGLRVQAVFGSLSAAEVGAGLGALVADGIAARLEAARATAAGPEVAHDELHVGLDLPVFDLDVGGVLMGGGATLELASLARDAEGGVEIRPTRGLNLELRFGVQDGWLVGGPGAGSREIEARWMSAHLDVPFDGSPGKTELVLHEARAFSAYRERWVVRADADGLAATVALPEVKAMLAGVTTRLRTASADLGRLLEAVGLSREGGLDPETLDRLLHDPGATVAAARTAGAEAIAGALRALVPSATGSLTSIGWQVGPATVSVDLGARTLSATLAPTAFEAGLPPLSGTVSFSPTAASFGLALGRLDPVSGGLRLAGRAGAVSDLALEWQAPAGTIRRLVILPAGGGASAADLQALVTVLLPATFAHAVASFCRSRLSSAGRAAFEAVFDALGLLAAADDRGMRALVHPLGLFDDPAAWLRQGVAGWRLDPGGSAVRLIDGLRGVFAPGAAPGTWPLGGDVAVLYGSTDGAISLRLQAKLDTTLDGRPLSTQVTGGLSIGPGGPPQPVLDASLTVDGRGLGVAIAPHLRLTLQRPAPATPLELYPSGPGLGSVLTDVGETVLPPLLNALCARRSDAAASLVKDVGRAVFDLGGALDLLDTGQFTGTRIGSFAADPAARLLARLPAMAVSGVAALAGALDPLATEVKVTGPTDGRVTLAFGSADSVRLTLDGQAASPAVELAATVTLPGVGQVTLERLRLSTDGVQVSATLGPATVSAGPFELHPVLAVRAGVAAAGFTRQLGLGLAIDGAASSAVHFRWALDQSPPELVVVRSNGTEDSSLAAVGTELLAHAASLATGVLVDQLGPSLTDLARTLLQGVVFLDQAGSTALDPTFFGDLLQTPERLLARLQRLLWNAASETLEITIDDTVTIGLRGVGPADGPKQLGLGLSLVDGKRFTIATGDPTVELEIDADWIEPHVDPGLTIFLVEGTRAGDQYTFSFAPGVAVAGVGLRFSKVSGPVLDLGGLSLDTIGLHLYGEASAAKLGGGVRLQLAGLAVSPAGAGGTNAVANSIVNDAGASGAANRPSFSPSLAVQIHPGQSGPSVSLRAGDPPGPWWVVVQRQLGPLYLERAGLNTVEQGGRLTRVDLLFDGRVSLFGLTASVDQLSLSWLGGDVFDVESWAVDLQGLAVSAEMSGVSLTGGLLKTTQNNQISYVGMLLGRFGIYGLSVFGGYTDDNGSPSFFVFGALNGPIGGPPAFFVTGIGGGLGINRGLRVPEDLSRFNEYPFIKALDPAARPTDDPMGELRRLNDYFPPLRGNFWFAAGISFTCFALVDGIAVVAVSFGDGLDINLLGLARMALPRPGAALVSIELGLLARFSTREGLFSIRAQLTENSWLLYEDVRLTGGFAFVVWWKGPNRGQFVLSLGGYHPSFHRDGYPDVPRLGLCWQVTREIVIKGGSYFALTSEALMAGVDVEVSADFGWAWARIAFGAHGIVYFDPFWFEVSAYARIAAGIKIDTFLGTIRISISIGASVRVWGPEFSGEATFHVGPASLTVGFGSERAIEKRVLAWPEFVGKYLEDAGGSARALSAITGRGTLPAATGGKTAAATADGSVERPFEVFAEFELTVTTTIPTRNFDAGDGVRAVGVTRSDGAPAQLGLAPMRASNLDSTLTLTLEHKGPAGYALVPDKLRLLGAGAALSTDAFPIGAWGPPQPDTEEKDLPKGEVLFAGNSVRVTAVAQQLDRGPRIDYYRVEAARRPLPLSAGGNARPDLLAEAGQVAGGLVKPGSAQAALTAARALLFTAERREDPPAGVQRRGARSNLARASFAGERTAPPLFGTLADGLAVSNAPDPTASAQPAPAAPSPAGPRAPFVAALLTSGAGVAERGPGTTVGDGRIKRRIAPTLGSVQTRLGPHLPAKMVVAPLPATVKGETVVPTGAIPRTDAPGIARTYRPGSTGGIRGLDGLVDGLAPARERRGAAAAVPDGSLLRSGDVVVLRLPDVAIDVNVERRPALAVEGNARLVLLACDGSVLLDDRVSGEVEIGNGVGLIAVQADPADDAAAGLIGWHASSRLATLGSHAALGPACVLGVDTPGEGSGVGWRVAADVVASAAVVNTRFSRPVSTVAVVLADADPERIQGIELQLEGATRAPGKHGAPRPPIVVLRGSEVVLVYAVVPGDGPVSVRVTSGGNWRLVGVLGGNEDPARLAEVILERGVVATAARVMATGGEGCRVVWKAPEDRSRAAVPRPRRGGKHGRR